MRSSPQCRSAPYGLDSQFMRVTKSAFRIFHSLWSTQSKALVNEADACLEFSCFFYDPTDVGNLISGSFAFSKSIFGSSWFMYHWSLAWRILSITLPSMWDECSCAVVWTFFGSFMIVSLNNNAGDDVCGSGYPTHQSWVLNWNLVGPKSVSAQCPV